MRPPGPSILPMYQVHSDSESIPMCARTLSIALKSVTGISPWTLQEPGTVVEGIHLDVSAPSARKTSRDECSKFYIEYEKKSKHMGTNE